MHDYHVRDKGIEGGSVAQLLQLEMPDGQLMWAMIEMPDGPSDAGLTDVITEKLHGFNESLHTLATTVRSALATARPEEATVEFGLELAAGKTGVVAALVGGSGKAAIKVTLKWTSSGADAQETSSAPDQGRTTA